MSFFGFQNPYCACQGPPNSLCPSCSRLAAIVVAHGIEPFPSPPSPSGGQGDNDDDGQDLIEIIPIYEGDEEEDDDDGDESLIEIIPIYEGDEEEDDNGGDESLIETTLIYEGDDEDYEESSPRTHLREYPEADAGARIAEVHRQEHEATEEAHATFSTTSSASRTDVSVLDDTSAYQRSEVGTDSDDGASDDSSDDSASEAGTELSEHEGWTREQLQEEFQAILQDILDSLKEVEFGSDKPQPD